MIIFYLLLKEAKYMIRRFLRQFMVGRYGFDKLNFALVILSFALSIILSIVNIFGLGILSRTYLWARVLSGLLSALSYLPYMIVLFRALSRNFEKRRKEEAAFMTVAGRWIQFFTKKINQRKDTLHRYYNCPGCHRTLRVPRGRGKIKIDCPHCSRQFTRKT